MRYHLVSSIFWFNYLAHSGFDSWSFFFQVSFFQIQESFRFLPDSHYFLHQVLFSSRCLSDSGLFHVQVSFKF
jgi:hypothetical protein